MPVQSLDEISAADVAASQAVMTQLIAERYPQAELAQRGVLHDIVAFLAGGVVGAVFREEIDRVQRSSSLLAITQDPELADTEVVDAVLSNFGLVRRDGTSARGEILIVATASATLVVPAGTLFLADGVEFRTDTAIAARLATTAATGPNDRVMRQRTDGHYDFTVPATAVLTGAGGNVRSGTRMVPDQPPPRFLAATASGDFSGGTETETNSDILSRLKAGISAKAVAGRSNIEAVIRDRAVFADLRALSVIGCGDPEMARDQHSIIPVSAGNRVDVYVKMQAVPHTIIVAKTAVLVGLQGASSTWQIALSRDDVPGFYYVAGVRTETMPADVAGFSPISDTRAFSLADDAWSPDIVNAAEAAFSPYQTAIIRISDDITPTAGLALGDTAQYLLSVVTQPRLRELQDFLGSYGVRPVGADILVKGAVPCLVSLGCEITSPADVSAPDTAAIAAALAEKVGNTGFGAAIYASQLSDVVYNLLSEGQVVSRLTLHGRIYTPDGESIVLRDDRVLQAPELPGRFVTPRTVAFSLFVSDIEITVVSA